MNDLINMLEQYSISTILILFSFFILIAFGIYDLVNKIKKIFNTYHEKMSDEEHKDDIVNERLTTLELEHDNNKKEIIDMKEEIENIRNLIEKVQFNMNHSNRATCRSAMYRLSNELITKGWMTEDEYETLSDLVDVYMMSASPSDSHNRPSLIERALNLPILTTEEILEYQRSGKLPSSKENTKK